MHAGMFQCCFVRERGPCGEEADVIPIGNKCMPTGASLNTQPQVCLTRPEHAHESDHPSHSSVGPFVVVVGLAGLTSLAAISSVTLVNGAYVAMMLGAITCGLILPRRRDSATHEEPMSAESHFFNGKAWYELRCQLCAETRKAAAFAEAEADGRMPSAVAAAFQECSTPGKAECRVRVVRAPGVRAQLTVAADMDMKGMRLVSTISPTSAEQAIPPGPSGNAGLSVVGGTLQMMLEPETYPEWVLFCERVDVLHRWGPQEVLFVLYMKLPIVNIRIECMLYIGFFDDLDEDGCAGAVIAGGARIEKLAQLLGIPAPVPHNRGPVVKANLDFCKASVYPSKKNPHGRWILSVEESCPMDWMVRHIWKALSGRLMGILSREADARMHQPKTQHEEGFSESAARIRYDFYKHLEERCRSKIEEEFHCSEQ